MEHAPRARHPIHAADLREFAGKTRCARLDPRHRRKRDPACARTLRKQLRLAQPIRRRHVGLDKHHAAARCEPRAIDRVAREVKTAVELRGP